MTGTGIATSEGRRRGIWAAVGLAGVVIVLMGAGASAKDALNPSFETTYAGLPWPRPLPLYWGRLDHPSFNSYCTNLWSTDGSKSAALFNRIGKTVAPGNHQSFTQYVDLTGIGSIEFDVRLAVYPEGVFEHFEAALFVNNVMLWSQNAEGVYLSQKVNVSHLSGWHRVEMRHIARDGGAFSVAYWSQWDNVRLVEGPTTIPAVIDLNPGTLNLDSKGQWVTCYIELLDGHDVGTIDAATVTLNGIPAHLGTEGWATALANDDNLTDHDLDGILERMVKFERAAVQAIVQPPEATVTVKGRLTGGTPFEGTAVIRVLDNDAKKK